jgi:hypothetical protein
MKFLFSGGGDHDACCVIGHLPFSLLETHPRFGETSCLYILCTNTVKMEAIDSSGIFVSFNRATNQRTVNVMVYKHGLNAQ